MTLYVYIYTEDIENGGHHNYPAGIFYRRKNKRTFLSTQVDVHEWGNLLLDIDLVIRLKRSLLEVKSYEL